jgi:hypothetical protein
MQCVCQGIVLGRATTTQQQASQLTRAWFSVCRVPIPCYRAKLYVRFIVCSKCRVCQTIWRPRILLSTRANWHFLYLHNKHLVCRVSSNEFVDQRLLWHRLTPRVCSIKCNLSLAWPRRTNVVHGFGSIAWNYRLSRYTGMDGCCSDWLIGWLIDWLIDWPTTIWSDQQFLDLCELVASRNGGSLMQRNATAMILCNIKAFVSTFGGRDTVITDEALGPLPANLRSLVLLVNEISSTIDEEVQELRRQPFALCHKLQLRINTYCSWLILLNFMAELVCVGLSCRSFAANITCSLVYDRRTPLAASASVRTCANPTWPTSCYRPCSDMRACLLLSMHSIRWNWIQPSRRSSC